jgi:hypothetical protein
MYWREGWQSVSCSKFSIDVESLISWLIGFHSNLSQQVALVIVSLYHRVLQVAQGIPTPPAQGTPPPAMVQALALPKGLRKQAIWSVFPSHSALEPSLILLLAGRKCYCSCCKLMWSSFLEYSFYSLVLGHPHGTFLVSRAWRSWGGSRSNCQAR